MAHHQRVKVQILAMDVLDLGADVLALKWGQGEVWDSVQRALGNLTNHRAPGSAPPTEPFHLYDSPRSIAAERVLLVGSSAPKEFGYDDMQDFVRSSLKFIAKNLPKTRRLALLVYGVHEGHNETQALRKELDAIMAAAASGDLPQDLETISFVVAHKFLANKLAPVLTLLIPGGWLDASGAQNKAD